MYFYKKAKTYLSKFLTIFYFIFTFATACFIRLCTYPIAVICFHSYSRDLFYILNDMIVDLLLQYPGVFY